MQDDLEKLAAAEAEEGSGDSSNSDSDSDSSSDSSSFGCMTDDAPKKGAKRKSSKGPGKGVPKKRAQTTPPADKAEPKTKPKGKEDPKAAARENSTAESAEKLLGLLEELAGATVWRSVVRATEIDRRLSKVHPVCCELEDAMKALGPESERSDEEQTRFSRLHDLFMKLETESERVTSLKEMSKFIRAASPDDMIADVATAGSIKHHFAKCYKSVIEAEGTLVDMILAVGKKLLEVSWQHDLTLPLQTHTDKVTQCLVLVFTV